MEVSGIEERMEKLNQMIGRYFPKREEHNSLVMEAMIYSLEAGGKRIRPMLLFETTKMLGGLISDAAPFGAAVEMIHTYSLVHDDLPEMDNDQYRRGKLTTHAKYGQAIGVLAGDGLLNYAFEVMSKAVARGGKKEAKAMGIIAEKAGVYGMIGGQNDDLLAVGKKMTKDKLDRINLLKTSALLSGSMLAGAALAGADVETAALLEKAGNAFGLAFQIQDDILDEIGDEKKLGKPLHSDKKNMKQTYVELVGLENAKQEVERLTELSVQSLKQIGSVSDFLIHLVQSYMNREY